MLQANGFENVNICRKTRCIRDVQSATDKTFMNIIMIERFYSVIMRTSVGRVDDLYKRNYFGLFNCKVADSTSIQTRAPDSNVPTNHSFNGKQIRSAVEAVFYAVMKRKNDA